MRLTDVINLKNCTYMTIRLNRYVYFVKSFKFLIFKDIRFFVLRPGKTQDNFAIIEPNKTGYIYNHDIKHIFRFPSARSNHSKSVEVLIFLAIVLNESPD
jgi:hypothetical protein